MSHLENWAIVAFELKEGYKIYLKFSDGKERVIDFEPVVGAGWMAPLKDLTYFRTVKLNEMGNLEWPDGQDFNPEELYDWDIYEKMHIEDAKRL